MDLRMGTREWLLLLVLSLLWGGSFFFNEIALQSLHPFTIVLGRVGLASLALLTFVYASGLRLPVDRGVWGAFLLMGAFNNVLPFSLIVWGQSQISSGLASILNATTPLFAVLVAHVITSDERLTGNRLLGVVIGFAGVVALIGPDALRSLGLQVWGQIAVLGAALSYACAAIYGRRFRSLPSMITAAGSLVGATVWMIPLALFLDRPWQAVPSVASIAALLGLALLSSAVAYLIYFHLIAHSGATNATLVTFLIPVSAILLGALFLEERFGLGTFIGMGLIFCGLAAVDGRLARMIRRPRPVSIAS